MSASWTETCRVVRALAQGRCAYCRMHQSLQGATFHVEHIVPQSEGGSDDHDNLCLACPSCNLCKSNRTKSIDPLTRQESPLFHPRLQVWAEHFQWNGLEVLGRTAIGRGTVAALELNSERRQRIREAERLFDLFPAND